MQGSCFTTAAQTLLPLYPFPTQTRLLLLSSRLVPLGNAGEPGKDAKNSGREPFAVVPWQCYLSKQVLQPIPSRQRGPSQWV